MSPNLDKHGVQLAVFEYLLCKKSTFLPKSEPYFYKQPETKPLRPMGLIKMSVAAQNIEKDSTDPSFRNLLYVMTLLPSINTTLH